MGLVLTSEAIKQSMEDGFFQGYGTEPNEREIEACIEFFESLRRGINHVHINALFHCVISRELLISSFDMNTKYPEFILNEIKSQ